jgi:hypothetical protein
MTMATKLELIAQMKEKYLESEDLWWMTEYPDVVVEDIRNLLVQFEHTYRQLEDIMGVD